MKPHVFQHFQTVDPVLAKVIPLIKPFEVEKRTDYFAELCDAILSQQLSTKVAAVIYDRFTQLFPDQKVTSEFLLTLPHEQIKGIGTSNAKAKYLRYLAEAVGNDTLPIARLDEMSDEDVIVALTQVKGIGPWTAEMFLMFSLAREDVFSVGDLGLRRAVQKLYALEQEPTKEYLLALSQKWRPYRTYASRILWRSLEIPTE
jgi:DNA-3-methyladenine glycosylase II